MGDGPWGPCGYKRSDQKCHNPVPHGPDEKCNWCSRGERKLNPDDIYMKSSPDLYLQFEAIVIEADDDDFRDEEVDAKKKKEVVRVFEFLREEQEQHNGMQPIIKYRVRSSPTLTSSDGYTFDGYFTQAINPRSLAKSQLSHGKIKWDEFTWHSKQIDFYSGMDIILQLKLPKAHVDRVNLWLDRQCPHQNFNMNTVADFDVETGRKFAHQMIEKERIHFLNTNDLSRMYKKLASEAEWTTEQFADKTNRGMLAIFTQGDDQGDDDPQADHDTITAYSSYLYEIVLPEAPPKKMAYYNRALHRMEYRDDIDPDSIEYRLKKHFIKIRFHQNSLPNRKISSKFDLNV